MRLRIHAEIDALVNKWREEYEDMRDAACGNSTDLACADELERCARKLAELNERVERGE